jgi:hypothetical protein
MNNTDKEYFGYYDIEKKYIFVNPKLKGLKKLRWLFHEQVHKLICHFSSGKIRKWVNFIWDILDNDFKLLNFYFKYRNTEANLLFGGGGDVVTTKSYHYRIKACHTNLNPLESIYCYDAYGELVYTIPPNYAYMDYANGILDVPGSEKNTTVESISTATYYVLYSTSDLIIDYDNAKFYIKKSMIKNTSSAKVKATYEYYTVISTWADINKVIDGDYDTQVQTVFYAEPPTGYNYAVMDLGEVKTIQALDILAGYFKPDEYRKFDPSFTMTLQYSLDGTNYYDISDETNGFDLSGGDSKSFEEEDLGVDFETRYLKVVLENVDKIDYSSEQITVSDDNRETLYNAGLISSDTDNGTIIVIRDGIYAVAFAEISAYSDITIKSEAKLIPTTYLSSAPSYESGYYESGESGLSWESGGYSIPVSNTYGFSSSGIAYIKNNDGTFDSFHYDSLTATSFESCSGLEKEHLVGDMVVQEIEGDLTVYDTEELLPKLKDRVYKKDMVDDDTLFSTSQVNYVAKEYLKEFIKNHTKGNVELMWSPFMNVGDTIRVISTHNGIDTNFFIDSIEENENTTSLVVARYPA